MTALREALTDSHYAVRGFAALGLGLTGAPKAKDGLRKLLRSADPAVRASGAIALGALGDTGAIKALAHLARRGAPQQRGAALWGLGIAHASAAVGPARRLLERRSHPDLRATAAAILAVVPGRDADRLLQRALTDRHATVRREAARAFGLRSTTTGTARLTRVLKSGRPLSGAARVSVLEALAAAGDRHRDGEVADVLRGVPAAVVPELAAALLRTLEPAYRPTRY